MRRVGIEVLGRDLVGADLGGGSGGGSANGGEGEWRELCRLWSGVRRLEMVVKGGLFVDAAASTATPFPDTSSSSRGQLQSSGKTSILNPSHDWVAHGLLSLFSLRTLELEIEDKDVSSGVKMEFCAALEALLNNQERKNRISAGDGEGWMGDVRVVFVEKSKILKDGKGGKEKGFVYYGGEPGDETRWSEEM